MSIPIIFEDSAFLIIDKPSGIVVNRSENAPDGTVQDWIEERTINNLSSRGMHQKVRPVAIPQELPQHHGIASSDVHRTRNDNDSDFIKRSGIVHRIDKETSGLLVIAKTPEAFENLQKQFLDRTVTKKYQALVHGKVVPDESIIKAPVGRLPWNRRKFGVLAEGREAETGYKVIKYYSCLHCHSRPVVIPAKAGIYGVNSSGNPDPPVKPEDDKKIFSYLSVFPHTGRTHQIRIHLQYLGFPIVSDPLYLPKNVYEEDIKWCPRLFLHAAYLKLQHPETGEWKAFESNLPHDLEISLETHLHT